MSLITAHLSLTPGRHEVGAGARPPALHNTKSYLFGLFNTKLPPVSTRAAAMGSVCGAGRAGPHAQPVGLQTKPPHSPRPYICPVTSPPLLSSDVAVAPIPQAFHTPGFPHRPSRSVGSSGRSQLLEIRPIQQRANYTPVTHNLLTFPP